MEINYFEPKSPKFLLDEYKELRDPEPERDKDYSPLHDAIISAISKNIKEYCPDAYDQAWTSSLFPERLTDEILRLVEKQIIRGF